MAESSLTDTEADTDLDTEADTEIDGRTARRDRNRVAVLDAVLELFTEGNLTPSPDDVARRSGVSLRSVYRYVADADDLIRAAIVRHQEKVAPLFVIADLGEGSFEHRLDAFVDCAAASVRSDRGDLPRRAPARTKQRDHPRPAGARSAIAPVSAGTAVRARARTPRAEVAARRCGRGRRAHPDRDDRPLPASPAVLVGGEPGDVAARAAGPPGSQVLTPLLPEPTVTRMGTVRRQVRIARSADDVWAVVGDPLVDRAVVSRASSTRRSTARPARSRPRRESRCPRRSSPTTRSSAGSSTASPAASCATTSGRSTCSTSATTPASSPTPPTASPIAMALIIGGATGNALLELKRQLEAPPSRSHQE